MLKTKTVLRIRDTGIMAIVRVENMERGREIAQACLDGGVDVLEISYTLDNAGEIISGLSKEFGDKILIGAGTVLDSETARLAILSGAKFVIAPNFNKQVALLCNRYQIAYAPGCSTLSEMVEAMEYGASYVKVFPIANYFGPSIVKTIKTPIPNMPVLSSGGVTLDNVKEWFQNGADSVGVGTLLTKGSYEEIKENAQVLRNAVNAVRNG